MRRRRIAALHPNLFIFDMSVMPPTQKRRITVGGGYTDIHWITASIDGNFVYPSPHQNRGTPVQIYDSRTWLPIGTIADSEKLMEVDFQDGRVVAVGIRGWQRHSDGGR